MLMAHWSSSWSSSSGKTTCIPQNTVKMLRFLGKPTRLPHNHHQTPWIALNPSSNTLCQPIYKILCSIHYLLCFFSVYAVSPRPCVLQGTTACTDWIPTFDWYLHLALLNVLLLQPMLHKIYDTLLKTWQDDPIWVLHDKTQRNSI